MHRFRVISLAGAAIVVFAGLSPSAVNASPLPSGPAARHHHAACAATGSGYARCFVDVVDHGASDPTPAVTPAPSGLSPTTMASAYNFPTASTAGAGATVAIVDAYNDPTAQSDLNAFDTQYGLSCNTCLTKVNQSGGTSYPSTDGGWSLEISLDVQWVHAIAPGAQILLVEASSNSFNDLLTAEVYAAKHAQYVSNSWGGGEFNGESSYDSAFTQSGVSYFVAAGDNGLPAEYPSASPDVISVGGTTLNNIGAPNFSETAWSGGGGGCSAYESATSAQAHYPTYDQFNANCSGSRATPDVALDADPNSGAAVYDSTPYSGSTGWFQVGGTSLATPMWAAESAVAGGGVMNSSRIYGSSNTAPTFRDITSGNNGAPALVGYDLASGLGSWAAYPSGPPPPTTVPGAPTGLGATPGKTSVALAWTAPASNGGSPITGYNVFKGTTSGVEGSTPVNTSPLAANAASYNATGLTNGTTYFFTVKAVNSVGSSVPSNEASATPTGSATVPGAPTGLAAHTATSKGVTLTWSAPASNGGATITGYRLNRSTRSGRETFYVTVSCTPTCSYTDTGAYSRTTYYYDMAATNQVGPGPVSNQASARAR